MIQYIYQSKHLVIIDESVYVYICIYQKCKFDEPFISFKLKQSFIG